MLYDARGTPIREIQPIIDDVMEKGVDYNVYSKESMEGQHGELHTKLSLADYTHRGKKHKILVSGEEEIRVGKHVPDRYKDIIAVHEDGHKRGLTHGEIWLIELATADELARRNNDPTLKEDYIRWSSNDEKFQLVRNNLGKVESQTLHDLPEYRNKEIMREYGVEGIFKEIDGTLTELPSVPD